MLGVALKDVQKHSRTHYTFKGETFRGEAKSLSLECRGNITQMNVEDVADLPAGKNFLGALPWAVSLFLPSTSSSFSLELVLGKKAA